MFIGLVSFILLSLTFTLKTVKSRRIQKHSLWLVLSLQLLLLCCLSLYMYFPRKIIMVTKLLLWSRYSLQVCVFLRSLLLAPFTQNRLVPSHYISFPCWVPILLGFIDLTAFLIWAWSMLLVNSLQRSLILLWISIWSFL